MALHVTQFNTCWSNGEYLSRVCTSHIMDTRASDAYFLVSCVVPTHRPALAITCRAHVSCKHVTCSHTCLCHRQRAPHSRYPSSLPSCWLTQCRVSNCRSRHSRSRLRVWKIMKINSPDKPVFSVIITTLVKDLGMSQNVQINLLYQFCLKRYPIIDVQAPPILLVHRSVIDSSMRLQAVNSELILLIGGCCWWRGYCNMFAAFRSYFYELYTESHKKRKLMSWCHNYNWETFSRLFTFFSGSGQNKSFRILSLNYLLLP